MWSFRLMDYSNIFNEFTIVCSFSIKFFLGTPWIRAMTAYQTVQKREWIKFLGSGLSQQDCSTLAKGYIVRKKHYVYMEWDFD